jgi:hypothetical protein
MNGERVPLTDEGHVFVYTRFQTLVEVPLSEKELAAIKFGELEKLPQTRVWQEKIAPLREEYGGNLRPGERTGLDRRNELPDS